MDTLLYFHDPMCSWCWAFRPVWQAIRAGLPSDVSVRQVLGGLAPDDPEPMPVELRHIIRQIWQTAQDVVPGTEFNYGFWERCTPRRCTYPACRAVIAARRQGASFEDTMILAIQHAYYLEARNPSEEGTLIELAGEIGLDPSAFAHDLFEPGTQQELLSEIELAQRQRVRGFPTLILQQGQDFRDIALDYTDASVSLDDIMTRS